jgi:DNA polymerase sigma
MSPHVSPLSCSIDELMQMPTADRLDYIRRLLRSYAAHVCHVQRIAHARCPVLRFCHKQEKIFCELSINNQYVKHTSMYFTYLLLVLFSLAVANTELIRYCLVCEPKLSPLLYTIRLWMKQKDLLGRGHRFNTYTLFWMIIFSMQSNANNQLPSIQSLSNRSRTKLVHLK